MLPFLTILNSIVEAYISSLKKDLAEAGFEVILLVVSVSWVSLVLLIILFLSGNMQMPTDPWFYLFWFGVTSIYTIHFSFFIAGLKNSLFLAANTLKNIGFVITALYGVALLGERLTLPQTCALALAAVGAMLFFNWNKTEGLKIQNKGLIFILFSVIIAPLGGIFMKAATLHTNSYGQFLTGRVVVDAVYYTLFFFAFYIFWYKKSPKPNTVSLFTSPTGLVYVILAAGNSLFGSWLIFKLPISTVTLLASVSIPVGYIIGKIKYKEQIELKYVVGGIFIVFAVILFASFV